MPECGQIKQKQKHCRTCIENQKEKISDECAACVNKSNWRGING